MDTTGRSRLVLLPLAVVVLSACSTPIAGRPEPAAGFQDPPKQTTSPTPEIPTPRRIDGVDPCRLLAPEDLAVAGGVVGPPRPGNPLAGTCSYPVGGGPEDTAAAGAHIAFGDAIARQPRGVPVAVEGYSAWLSCEVVGGHQTCASVTAVRPDRSLLTLLSKQGATAADTADTLFRLTSAVLRKLPAGMSGAGTSPPAPR